MNREDVRKNLRGSIATVPTAFDDNFRVDFARMAELTNWWIENGLVKGKCVIKVAAVGGEGEKLREEEGAHLLQTVVQASKGRVTIWGAIHHLDTYRAIEYAKRAKDVGVEGIQVSPPFMNVGTQDGILRHYQDLSSAVDLGILVYNTPWFDGGAIYPDTLRKMVDFESVVGIKWSNKYSKGNEYPYEEIFDVKDKVNIIDNTVSPILNHKLGGHGYIQTAIHIHPPHDLKIMELMDQGKYDEAEELFESVMPKLRAFRADVKKKTGHDAGEKAVMNIMGNHVGQRRPPVNPINSEEKAQLRSLIESFGWPLP